MKIYTILLILAMLLFTACAQQSPQVDITDADDTSDTSDTTDSGDTPDADDTSDGTTDADDTTDDSGDDTLDSGETTDADDTSGTDDTTDTGDTTDADDTTGSDDTAGADDTTDADDTADADGTTDADDTAEEEDNGSITNVIISNLKFVPADITIPAGRTVRWTHDNTYAGSTNIYHQLNFYYDGASEARSDRLSLGDTWEYTFTKPGEYWYMDVIHKTMRGNIIVEEVE